MSHTQGVQITARLIRDISPSTFTELKKRVNVDAKYVKVGIPSSEKETDGTSLAMIGAVNEFGSPDKGIPERPFLRPGTRRGKPDFIRLNRVNLVKMLRKQMSIDKGLGQLGAMAVGKVKQEIRNGEFKALAADTIAARKRRLSPKYRAKLEAKLGHPLNLDKPLIDSGNLIQGVTYQIVPKGQK
jgi:hypothetical protein